MTIDGRSFDDRCFTEYVEYYEGDFTFTKYGKCLGYYECANKNPLAAMTCYMDNTTGFDSEDFFLKLSSHGFDNPFPFRLCTEGNGGRCNRPKYIDTDYIDGF